MNLHLIEISKEVAVGAHAVLLCDGAGYHNKAALDIPENITLMHLPPYSPELNCIENIWEYLRGNMLSNTVFDDDAHIVDASCDAWQFFATDAAAIATITRTPWARIGN